MKEYWRNKKKEADLEEAKIKADALAEEATKTAEQNKKDEEERLKGEKEDADKKKK